MNNENNNQNENEQIKKNDMSLIKNQIPIIKITIDAQEINEAKKVPDIENSFYYKDIPYHPKYLNSEETKLNSNEKQNLNQSSDSLYHKGSILNPEAFDQIKREEEIKKIANLPFLKKIYKNFFLLSTGRKILFFVVLILSLFVVVFVLYLFFKGVIKSAIEKTKETKFFCLGGDLFSGEFENTLCIIAIGQTAKGIFALGQIAYGVVAIGQMSIGLITIGQFSVGLFFVFVAQIGLGFFCYITQFGVAGIYSKLSFLSTCPIRPLLQPEKLPFKFCCA